MKVNNQSLFEKKEENLMSWVSYWRKNPHRFASDYLGIGLFFFQKVLIYLMNRVPLFVFIAARGMGKTYLVAIYAITRCILYPGSKVIIVAPTRGQSREVVGKIQEIYNRSDGLKSELVGPKSIRTQINSAGVDFKNGSMIQTAVSGDNARGKRGNVLIVDEFRLVKYEDYKMVVKPILNVPRIPRFKEKYPYKYADYSESNVEILMSSAWYKSNWSWETFKSTASRMIDDFEKAITVALPYQLSMLHGILQQDVIDNFLSDDGNDIYSFMIEYEAQFIGESENAFFTYDMMDKNRVLLKAFVPPDDLVYKENKLLSRPKELSNMPLQKGEIRIVSLDVALMGGKENDTSVITGMRLIPNKEGGFDRHVVYIKTLGYDGITNQELAKQFKRAYYDFDATYAVLDAMGNGLGVYDELAEPTYDEARDEEYEAWSSMNDETMRTRFNNRNAKQILYTVKASPKYNTEIALLLKSGLTSGKIKLLINDIERRDNMVANKERFEDLDDQQRHLASHQQTTALVNELISLSWSHAHGGNIRISEPLNGTKDRYTSLAYANEFANQLELKHKKTKTVERFDPRKMVTRWK